MLIFPNDKCGFIEQESIKQETKTPKHKRTNKHKYRFNKTSL